MTAIATLVKEIRRGLEVLCDPGFVYELRSLHTKQGTISGYYSDLDKLAADAAELDGKVPALYVTLNPVNPDLLARAHNRWKPYAKVTTNDNEVVRRLRFGFDFDPARPADISASNAEHDAALARALEALDWLAGEGWPDGANLDSGNGGHLVFRGNLPNDAASLALLTRCLAALDFRFSDNLVKVDLKVCNAARIWKVPGTLACKGDNVPDRPHRRAAILHLPDPLVEVPRDLVEAVAAQAPRPAPRSSNNDHRGRLDVEAWIVQHGLPVVRTAPWQDGRKWILRPCPWDENHTNDSAFLIQFGNGAISAGCHHNSCHGKDWHALRDLYEPGWRTRSTTTNHQGPTAAPQEAPAGQILLEANRTDLGNARRFVSLHGDQVRYCHISEKWYVWDGRRWKEDDTDQVERLGKDTIRALYAVAGDIQEEKARVQLVQHALRTESQGKVRAMIELAKSEDGIPVRLEDLDKNPWYLNVLNGTLDLQTGILRPHQREDLISKLCPVPYDPVATCPQWDAFLTRAMDGAVDKIRFLQRYIGYALTGDVREHCFALLYGIGRNGKTTLVELLQDLLGDYAESTPTETLMEKKYPGIPSDVAQLRGARLVTAVETKAGRHLAESLIKQMTGGDTLKARFMYADWFRFRPSFKLILSTNNKPVIRGTDYAIWQRVRLVPFTVQIPTAERDKTLPAKLRTELPGILRWAVEGCLAWQMDGLDEPEEIQQATADYEEEMNVIAPFLDECCVVGPEYKVTVADLYNAYLTWCERTKEREPESKTAFGERLTGKGFEPPKRGAHGVRGWKGIGLK